MWYQKKYSNFSEGSGTVLRNGKPLPPLKEYGTLGTEGNCMVNSIHALQIIIASNVSGSIRDLYSSSIRVTVEKADSDGTLVAGTAINSTKVLL